MQQSIHNNHFKAAHAYGQDYDNPERMLFYAMLGSIISWSVIGVFGWAVWQLIG